MTPTELVEYIEHVLATLEQDAVTIYDATRVIRNTAVTDTRNRLDWNLVHQHVNLEAYRTDLERHVQLLNREINAGTKV